jgi:predicted XRE-type DNA-binding protein
MIMNKESKHRLKSAGWKIGGAKEFLGLSEEEAAIVELKLALADAVKEKRHQRKMTQEKAGQLLGTSQSRIAKMESADRSVTIDLLVRSLLRMGASRKELASYIAVSERKRLVRFNNEAIAKKAVPGQKAAGL